MWVNKGSEFYNRSMRPMKKKLLECFTRMNCKKKNQKQFKIENVIKRKGDKLYVKWKGYVHLMVRQIKKLQHKTVNIFQNQNLQEKGGKLNLS